MRILNDALAEGSETIPLLLTNANPAAALGSPSAATLTIQEDREPVVQFSASKVTAREWAVTHRVAVTVRRLGSLAGTVHVDYATSAGTGVPGVNYFDTAGQLTFGPGVAIRSFDVTVLSNVADEANPTVHLSLARVDIPLGTPSSALLTIVDDDVAGEAQLGASAFSGPVAAGFVTVTVARSGGLAGPASVQYATGDATAVAGTDYTTTTGTATFGPGETEAQIKIPVASTGPPAKYLWVTLGATTGGLSLGPITQAPVWLLE